MINWTEIDFLDSITKVSTNGKKVRQKDYLIEGKFPVIDQGQDFIGGYTNDATKAIINQGSVVVFGDHTLVVKLVPFDFVPGADGIKGKGDEQHRKAAAYQAGEEENDGKQHQLHGNKTEPG